MHIACAPEILILVDTRRSKVNTKMAEDSELDAIRARRMAELQAQLGAGGGGDAAAKQKAMQQQQAKQEEMKNMMLTQILEQNARARLNSIALVKPERARQVEAILIQMAQTGQIPGKVSETQLVELLEKVSQQAQKKTTVKFERRRLDDSDDDF